MSIKTSVETHEGYKCNGCEQFYHESEDAKSCCPNAAKEEERYACPDCGDDFDTQGEAKSCCLDTRSVKVTCPDCRKSTYISDLDGLNQVKMCCLSPEIVSKYTCPKCDEVYDEEHEAGECCAPYAPAQFYECTQCTFRSQDKWKAMQHCA